MHTIELPREYNKTVVVPRLYPIPDSLLFLLETEVLERESVPHVVLTYRESDHHTQYSHLPTPLHSIPHHLFHNICDKLQSPPTSTIGTSSIFLLPLESYRNLYEGSKSNREAIAETLSPVTLRETSDCPV